MVDMKMSRLSGILSSKWCLTVQFFNFENSFSNYFVDFNPIYVSWIQIPSLNVLEESSDSKKYDIQTFAPYRYVRSEA